MRRCAYTLLILLFSGLSAACSSSPPASVPAPTPTIMRTLPVSETPAPTTTPVLTPTVTQGALRVMAVGDVMLGRQVQIGMIERKDYTWPFHNTADLLREADLAIGNLEHPIVSYCKPSDGGDVLCAGPNVVEGLTFAGFDVLSLSNNHSNDYGTDAFDGTIKYLEDAQIAPVRMGSPVFREINGKHIGIVAFDDSEIELNVDEAISEVKGVRGKVDILIAVLHWGYEYHPTASTRQEKVGHALIDAGVDVIIGAHPHWRQQVETYNNRIIFYSLGNFVFDQMWSEETRKGNMAEILITPSQDDLTIAYKLIPIEIFFFGQPALEKK